MIAFAPSPDEQAIVEQVHAFAADEMRPAARTCEERGGLPDALLTRTHAIGLPMLEYPERLGGLGLGMATRVLVEEELAWGDAGIAAALPGPGMAGYAVLECAAPTAAEVLLAPFTCDVRRSGALLVGDDVSGCEPEGVRLTAVQEAPGWRLRGRLFPLAPADAGLLAVIAAGPAGRPEVFAFDGDAPGVSVGPRLPTLGLGALASAEVSLDCALEDAACLERPERLAEVLDRARLVTAARAVGLARAAFEHAARYATERRAFGRPVAEHQAIAFMVADMAVAIDAARALLWRAAWRFDRGERAGAEVAMALAQALEAAMTVSTDAVQVLGGHGFMQDHPVEKWMRDAKSLALAWGTTQAAHRTIVEGLSAAD